MIIALAGRRVDATDADETRFPLDQVPAVLDRVRSMIRDAGATALVGSGACGADLLAMQAAGELGLRRRMVLPFAPAVFREKSVADRPGDWGPLFDRISGEIASNGDLIVLDQSGDPDAAYAAANVEILEEASRLARELGHEPANGVVAAVVWDGQERGSADLTADFARKARELGMAVTEVSTNASDPDPTHPTRIADAHSFLEQGRRSRLDPNPD